MTTVTVDAENSELNALLDRISDGEAEVVLERDGKPVARLVPATADQVDFERRREAFFQRMDRIRASVGDLPDDVLDREIEQAVQEVRTNQP